MYSLENMILFYLRRNILQRLRLPLTLAHFEAAKEVCVFGNPLYINVMDHLDCVLEDPKCCSTYTVIPVSAHQKYISGCCHSFKRETTGHCFLWFRMRLCVCVLRPNQTTYLSHEEQTLLKKKTSKLQVSNTSFRVYAQPRIKPRDPLHTVVSGRRMDHKFVW